MKRQSSNGRRCEYHDQRKYDQPEEADQIWAEAFVRWQCGEKLYLEGDSADEAVRQQEAHKESNPKEGIIRAFLDKPVPPNWYSISINVGTKASPR